MNITKDAIAGTLESSDVLVRVSPSDTLQIDITSSVQAQYGDAIAALTEAELAKLGVRSGHVVLQDKGALDCTLRARLEAAIMRSAGVAANWDGLKGADDE